MQNYFKSNHINSYEEQCRLTLFINHLDLLLKKHSKLYPVRLDFHYQPDAIKTAEVVYFDVNNLYQLAKNEFDTIVGFCSAIEFSTEKRFHIHTVFYVDGQKHQHFKKPYEVIKNIWEKNILGAGYIHCCHYEEQYKYDALTKFNHQDEIIISYLCRYLFPYFAKNDQKVGFIEERYQMAFSEVSEPSRRGRPRKKQLDINLHSFIDLNHYQETSFNNFNL